MITINKQAQKISSSNRIIELDGLRGIAILLIFFYHSRHFLEVLDFEGANILNSILQTMWIGVDVFFVLSGFLITRILLLTKNKKSYFKNFYIRRTLRIFPPYFLLLSVSLVIGKLLDLGSWPDFKWHYEHQIWYWTYMANWKQIALGHSQSIRLFIHLWSLAIEEQFYLIWPLIIYFLSEKKMLKIFMGLITMSFFYRFYYHFQSSSTYATYINTFARFDTFVFGALLAFSFTRGEKIFLRGKYIIFIAALISLLFLLLQGSSYYPAFSNSLGLLLIALIPFLLIYYCLKGSKHISFTFRNQLLVSLGKYSYAFYLFHWPIMRLMQYYKLSFGDGFVDYLLLTLFSFILSFIFSLLSWGFVERPFLKMKQYYSL
jgi:peptidoglycan/LPS O-acetylase OafA/YrhL